MTELQITQKERLVCVCLYGSCCGYIIIFTVTLGEVVVGTKKYIPNIENYILGLDFMFSNTNI